MSHYGVIGLVSLCYLLGLPAMDPYRPQLTDRVFKNFYEDVNRSAGLVFDQSWRLGRTAAMAVPQLASAVVPATKLDAVSGSQEQ